MIMPADQNLISFHIIQEDVFGKSMVTWSFPSLTERSRAYIVKKCSGILRGKEAVAFFRDENWIYLLKKKSNSTEPFLTIVIIAADFEPGKYELLCDVLCRKYRKTGNPVDLVKLYLSAFASGRCCFQENGAQVTYDLKQVQQSFKFKELVKMFGIETVVIYNCLLLKKRVLVYHGDLRKLQIVLISITKLMQCRNAKDYLYPLVENISKLRGVAFYVSGIINKAQNLKADIYDVFVDLQAEEITVSSKARGDLAMTKKHKEIATFLVQEAEKEDVSEEQLTTQLSQKTQDLLNQVRSLINAKTANGDMVTLEKLRSQKFSPTMENFLFNLAIAENIMMV